MVILDTNTIKIIIFIITFILSAIPLYRAVKFLKGKTNFPKTLFITLVSGLIISILSSLIKIYIGIISSIVLIWIYKKSFKLKWTKAFIVWIIQIILIIISSIIFGLLISIILKLPFFS
ncbi:hypothetical protein J4205_03735 [Candidatus Pacearchaeota archaeon]|nr:hypothetical protein [Candidatus Pacearchaeota archaeon]